MTVDEIKNLDPEDVKTLDLICDPHHALDALDNRDELTKILLACKQLWVARHYIFSELRKRIINLKQYER